MAPETIEQTTEIVPSASTSGDQTVPPAETPGVIAPVDPFALDETALASLSPEQRASLDPILDTWKKRATDEIQKKESEFSGKFKPLEEKALALDKLVKFQPFVQWWGAMQSDAKKNATPQEKQAIQEAQPQDIASPQEWQTAIWEASNGDASKLQAIQMRLIQQAAIPIVQQQNAFNTQIGLRDLFERHADAKELDKIGIDPQTKEGVSLLEMGLDWAERNRRPMEDGYAMAKRWSDSMKVSAQQQAMGIVTDKKAAVTAGPSTTNANQAVVEVADSNELIQKSLEAQIAGNKNTRFVIRGARS